VAALMFWILGLGSDDFRRLLGFLADVLIAREKAIYDEIKAMPGGWNGKRKFKVTNKFRKSDFICSITMKVC